MPRPLPGRPSACPSRPSRASVSSTRRKVGAVREQRAAELVGVLAGRVGQLVDEALHEEGVLGVPRRAPRPKRHVGVLQDAFDPQVGDLVGLVETSPSTVCGSRPSLTRGRIGSSRRQCGNRTRSAVPSAAKPGLEADRRLRAIAVVADVLLARPDQLDRLADRLADRDRLDHLVGAQPAAEAAAEKVLWM